LFTHHQHDIPNVSNFKECKIDSDYRKHIRTKYPGACSLEYQQVIEVFIDCILQWDSKEKRSKGRGIFGCVIAFMPAHEEQGLHSHWQIWVKELSPQVREDLWNDDLKTREEKYKEFYR